MEANPDSQSAEETKRRRKSLSDIGQELCRHVDAIVRSADLLSPTSQGDENIQHIRKTANDLLDLIQRELASPNESGVAPKNPDAQCDVLYIEDSPISFAAVQLLLRQRRKLKIVHANSGERGIAFAQTHKPQMILLDLNLPDIHGSEVITELKRNSVTASIPVVVLSADATPSQIERLLVLGAKNYLTKPFDAEPFLAVVDEALDGKGRTELKIPR
jgi:CheY-like chemotaxis protein